MIGLSKDILIISATARQEIKFCEAWKEKVREI
jgi:hypothetical protein